jgi:signal transduction histidine kinase
MPLKVLIVEDDKSFRRLVEIRLRSWRHDLAITCAETIKQAYAILDKEENSFALIILDQHLPDGAGSSLFDHPRAQESAVLAVSADEAPELPGKTVKAGALHFLAKQRISEPLLLPLLDGLLERKRLEAEVLKTRLQQSRMQSIRTLIRTLQHEINNPLGGVLGGAYLLRSSSPLNEEQAEALRVIEESGKRIKHVLSQLSAAAELEEVTKGQEQLFHIPGDPEWEK